MAASDFIQGFLPVVEGRNWARFHAHGQIGARFDNADRFGGAEIIEL